MSEVLEVIGNLERIIEKSGGRYYILKNVEDESKWNCNDLKTDKIEKGKVMLSSWKTIYPALKDIPLNTNLPGNIKLSMKYITKGNYNNIIEQEDAITLIDVETLDPSLIEANKQTVKLTNADLMESRNMMEQYDEHLVNGYEKAKELSEKVKDEKALPLFFEKIVSPYYYFVRDAGE